MLEEAKLDIPALIAPISAEKPLGSNYDDRVDSALVPLFSDLNSKASLARAYEKARYQNLISNIGGAGGAEEPQWLQIRDLAITILTKHTKDTRALVSLVEAQGHLFGLDGLQAAFAACNAMIEEYKVSLFPLPDEGEPPFFCLERLGQLCSSETYHLQSALFDASIFEEPNYSWIGFMSSQRLQKTLQGVTDEKERDRLKQESPMTMENFLLRLNDVKDRRVFASFQTKIDQLLAEALKLDALLSSLTTNRVAIGRLIDDLKKLQKWYKELIVPYWEKLPDVPATPDATATANPNVAESVATASGASGSAASQGVNSASVMASAVANREQAFANLRQVANFFRTTEPHSPVSYALEQAVRWGRMPLPDLLKEIVEDSSVLGSLYQRMGIREKEDKKTEDRSN